MKRVLSVLLALFLLTGTLPVFASAADSDFVIEGTTLTGYRGPGGDVVTPSGIKGIMGGAFEGDSINSVTITEGVTTINTEAFFCSGLKWISIPTSVNHVMSNSIMCANLKDIYYAGSQAQWNKILFDFNFGNALAQQATIHFNSTGPGSSTNPPAPTVGGFTDVKESDYFADAVVWAVNNNITSGVDNGKFGPNQKCTRGQIVTFLWNAAGKPEPQTSAGKFKDVKSGQYYSKAVQWAVEKGITSGKTDTTFAPNEPCTRAQAMTFIWVAAGESLVKDTQTQFTDLKAGSYYVTAVVWAVRQGITSGKTATTFGPNDPCTRGQIVTFLYNWKN